MKKIIKESTKKFTTECRKCDCAFEYELSDLIRVGGQLYVVCPHCGEYIFHSARIRKSNEETNMF